MPKFLITTAIDYPSGKPHMGHAYEKICTDVIARYKRLKGFDVHFSTGTDEHGMKIQRCAEKEKKSPKQYVDDMVKYFRELCDVLNISYDDFIRTTEPRHVKTAQEIFSIINKKGEIYKGTYEGLYCVDCETYYTEKDLSDGKCPVHGKEPDSVSEESYFFQMGKYREALTKHIEKNHDFIRPESKRKEILNRLQIPLKDLSVSRTSFNWGVPVPIDKKHVQYVWMDALINYLSTIGWPRGKSKEFWPTAVHIIGKDIVWHHTVIWGSILLAAGIAPPKTVFVHGFVNIKGEKISKSKGTPVDPIELADKYGADPLRYFLISEIPFGEDGDFTVESLVTRNNDELLNNLGNLANRILTFIYNKNGGKVTKPGTLDKLDKQLIESTRKYSRSVSEKMDRFDLQSALDEVMYLAKEGNEYFQQKEPWKKDYSNCLYVGANLLRTLAIMLSPFIPESAEKIWEYLNLPGSVHKQKWDSAADLAVKPNHKIKEPAPIFKKF
ncbi:MAG: methionine--tRNA ligase [Candidatus Aenigmatarchaeota archaeon]|nr:MAG: methionine--tRNA ligase [Candidatus Aenigmarchaeota archaeon]